MERWNFVSLQCLAVILLLVQVTHNTPQSNSIKFSIGETSGFQPLTSSFLSQPSFFSQKASLYANNQSPFVGYGPNYFYTLGNVGLNFQINQCPVIGANCIYGKYRSFDGSCNNAKNPAWGAANTRYGRLVQPKYSDGVRQPPVSVTGKPLPSARALSVLIFPDIKIDDPIWTLATMQWGQIVTHDMSLASGSTLAEQRTGQCCGPAETPVPGAYNYNNGPQECFPLDIPPQDPLNKNMGMSCVSFLRTRTDQQLGCPSAFGYSEQITLVSHWMDASFIYGSDDQTAQNLRAFKQGRLITEFRNGREWPPENVNRSMVCEGRAQLGVGSCYAAGDIRINQNTQLTVLQVLLLREHNRVASKLFEINPHWSDETLYQEARKIVIAEVQHISYYEWLPILLGVQNLLDHGVIYNAKDAYVNDYKEHIDPSVLNEHATAAFRLFHTNIQGFVDLITENRYTHGTIRLSDHYNDPTVIEDSNNFDDLTRGLATQPQKNTDVFHTSEITDFLFRNTQQVGFDLKAIDIQRGRDHGLASYNDMRQFCGLDRAHDFEDFVDFMEPNLVEKLKEFYAHPDDVDLFVGGALEKLVPGTLAGPTFLCIMTEQFYRTRVADKFFYERGDYKGAFSPEQLSEIRKTSLARIMCDNGDHIIQMQPRAFEKVSEKNPTVACHDFGAIPFVDLEAWRDFNLQQNIYHAQFLKK